ncbi:hypothetical protein LTS03_011932, partial [Exophiala xenobiotica]
MPSRRARAVAPKAQKRKYPQDTCGSCLRNRAACDGAKPCAQCLATEQSCDYSESSDAQRLTSGAAGVTEAHLQRATPSGSSSSRSSGEAEDTISVHRSPVSRSIVTLPRMNSVFSTDHFNRPPLPSTLVNNNPPQRDIINDSEEQLATGPQAISANPFGCVNGYELFGSEDLVTADHDLNSFHIPFDLGPVGQGWVNFMNPENPNSTEIPADMVRPGQDLITEATRTVEELRVEKRRADMSQAEVLSLQEKLHRAEVERDLRQVEVKDLEAKLHVAERDRDQAQQSIQEYQSQQ